jgi:Archaeal/vacuolar-type H+-ATPase subunit C
MTQMIDPSSGIDISSLSGTWGLIALVFGISILLVFIIAIFAGYFRILYNIASFASPVARAKAIGNPFLLRENMDQLIESKNLHEITSKMTDTGFLMGVEYEEDIIRIDRALKIAYYREYENLLTTVPDGIKPFFLAFRMVLEAEQVKSAIRGKFGRLSEDELNKIIIPVGIITPETVARICRAQSLQDAILLLHETPYGSILSESLESYSHSQSIFEMEWALDLSVFRRISESKIKVDSSLVGPVSEFIGLYSDIMNIKTLIRAKREHWSPEIISRFFVPGGAHYKEWRLVQLYENPQIQDIVNQLTGSDYYRVLEPQIPSYEGSGSLHSFETALDTMMLEKISSISSVYHLTGGPLIKFIMGKFIETKNIRAVIYGISRGISPEKIKEYVVCAGGPT